MFVRKMLMFVATLLLTQADEIAKSSDMNSTSISLQYVHLPRRMYAGQLVVVLHVHAQAVLNIIRHTSIYRAIKYFCVAVV